MSREDDALAKLLSLDCKNLDYNTFDGVKDHPRHHTLPKAVQIAIVAVAHVTSWAEHQAPEDFPMTQESLKYVEEYINRRIKPNILQWDADGNVSRVKHAGADAETTKPEAILQVESRLELAGYVFGQVVAQEIGGLWVADHSDKLLVSGPHGYMLNPFAKPYKFCRFGEEDSLAPMVAYAKSFGKTNHLLQVAQQQLIERGEIDMARFRNWQVWCGLDGAPEELRALDHHGVVMACAVLRRVDGPASPGGERSQFVAGEADEPGSSLP